MTHTTPDPLRDALAFYADDANWRQNGPLDPNSANFTGGPARAALAAAPERLAQAAEITMTYRNWRGEVAQRTIRPVAIWFGKTDWHPEPGWLLNAWDCDKGERRDFALADCQFALIGTPAPPTPAEPAGDVLREALESIRDMKTELTSSHDYSRGWNAALFRARQLADAALAAAPQPAPVMRDTIAALLDDRDAMAQRIEALKAALTACADDLEGCIHDGYDGVWSEADIQSEVAPYRAALAAAPAPQPETQPDTDDREAMVYLIECTLQDHPARHESAWHRAHYVADALLADGWRKADPLADERERDAARAEGYRQGQENMRSRIASPLFLRPLVDEQSAGEWYEETLAADTQMYADAILAVPLAPEGSS